MRRIRGLISAKRVETNWAGFKPPAEPLPAGEAGASKGKDGGGEGYLPFCTEPKAEEERGNDAAARRGNPSAREGRRPLALRIDFDGERRSAASAARGANKAARRPRSGREAPSSIAGRRREAAHPQEPKAGPSATGDALVDLREGSLPELGRDAVRPGAHSA
jgi:hypothetical protein